MRNKLLKVLTCLTVLLSTSSCSLLEGLFGNSGDNSSQNHKHVYEEKEDNLFLVSYATCTEGAVYYKSCSCGEHSEETFQANNAKGHNLKGTFYTSDERMYVVTLPADKVQIVWECYSCSAGKREEVYKDQTLHEHIGHYYTNLGPYHNYECAICHLNVMYEGHNDYCNCK